MLMKSQLFEHLNKIRSLMGVLHEGAITTQLDPDVKSAIDYLNSELSKAGKETISQKHIDKEIEMEGGIRPDNGGVDPKANSQIMKLISDAKSKFPNETNGASVDIVSGYRGYKAQADNFLKKVKGGRSVENVQSANTVPGFSQHHTGKAFDIFSVDTSWWDSRNNLKKWVENNAKNYGFVVTYTESGKLRIPEPWHLYYVGEESIKNKSETPTTDTKKISDSEVDAYFVSPSIDEKLEKNIEKQYLKSNCKKTANFTQSPTFEEVKGGDITIRIGHEGEEVEQIQKKLIDLGYDLGKCGVDGLFGRKTKKAIEDFQNDNSLTISSSIDLETLKKLDKGNNLAKPKSGDKKVDSKTETSGSKTKEKVSYKESLDDEYAISIPNGYNGKNVHVLFGGAHTNLAYSSRGYNSSNIKKYIKHVAPYISNAILVVTHHMNTLERVKEYVKKEFNGNVTSIAGFSQGGKETWEHAGDSNLRLVGLIDPSTYATGIKFGANTILYCDPKNWGTSGFYGQTRKRLEWYCDHKSEYPNQVICFNEGGTHMNFSILKSFYNQFGSRV